MAFYNWGEQVSNSFMNMLAMNQQKKLEEKRNQFETKRLGMEQQRVDMAEKELASNLEANEQAMLTNKQAYDLAGKQIKQFDEQRDAMNVMIPFDNIYNNQADNNMVPAWKAKLWDGQQEVSRQYNQFNASDGSVTPKIWWGKQSDSDSIMKMMADQFTQDYGVYSDKKTMDLKQKEMDISRQGNNIQGGMLDLNRATANLGLLGDAAKSIAASPLLPKYFRAYGGTLHPIAGKEADAASWLAGMKAAYPTLDPEQIVRSAYTDLQRREADALLPKNGTSAAARVAAATKFGVGVELKNTKRIYDIPNRTVGYKKTDDGNRTYVDIENNPTLKFKLKWDTTNNKMGYVTDPADGKNYYVRYGNKVIKKGDI